MITQPYVEEKRRGPAAGVPTVAVGPVTPPVEREREREIIYTLSLCREREGGGGREGGEGEREGGREREQMRKKNNHPIG
jgi:hypothetical protein